MPDLVIQAQKYLGIPWQANGRTKKGVDCYGLLLIFMSEQLDIQLPDFIYAVESNAERAAEIFKHMAETVIEVDVPVPGDIVLMTYQGSVCHIGIFLGSGYILHAPKCGVTLSSLTGMEHGRTLRSRIAGYYRYREA